MADGYDAANFSVDTQTPGISRIKAMYKDRWNNDPGYFTAGKKPPGAANYFSKAWNSYNDEDYLNQGDQSGLIAKMRNVVIEKSKDFQAGFDADESIQYDASTLKKDPQMPKAETFDGVAKAKVISISPEEQEADAEADQDVAAEAGRRWRLDRWHRRLA